MPQGAFASATLCALCRCVGKDILVTWISGLWGKCMVTFIETEVFPISFGGGFPHPAATADFDGDGRIEFVPTLFSFPGDQFFQLQVLEVQDDGSFLNIAPQLFGGDETIPVMEFGRNLVIRDFNNDGFDDLFIADHGFDADPFPGQSNIVALSDGLGGLVPAGFQFEDEPQFTHSVAVGDFNGDGNADFFVGNLGVDDAYIATLLPNGNVVQDRFDIGNDVNQFVYSLAADLDGDGIDELILGGDNNIDREARNVVVNLEGGTPLVRELPTLTSLSGTFDASRGAITLDIETLDLNGDGRLDLLLMATGVDPFYQGFDFQALQQTANGGFVDVTSRYFDGQQVANAVVDGAPLEIIISDLDVDGDEDILLVGFFPNDLTIFERDGGSFTAGDRFGGFGSAAVADIDGDFAPEIVQFEQGRVTVLDSGLQGVPVTPDGVRITGEIIDGDGDANNLTGTDANDSIDGGAGADMIDGGRGADLLIGGAGADTLTGRGGKDTLEGNGGRDMLSGNGGKDHLNGGGGRDRLEGNGGKDTLEGGGGRDDLNGGGGKDALDGGGGKDRIEGGRGADLLTGGGGRDTFVFEAGTGSDTILDWRDRQDRIEIDGAAFDDLAISQSGDNVLIRYANIRITVEDADADLFTTADFIF